MSLLQHAIRVTVRLNFFIVLHPCSYCLHYCGIVVVWSYASQLCAIIMFCLLYITMRACTCVHAHVCLRTRAWYLLCVCLLSAFLYSLSVSLCVCVSLYLSTFLFSVCKAVWAQTGLGVCIMRNRKLREIARKLIPRYMSGIVRSRELKVAIAAGKVRKVSIGHLWTERC